MVSPPPGILGSPIADRTNVVLTVDTDIVRHRNEPRNNGDLAQNQKTLVVQYHELKIHDELQNKNRRPHRRWRER